MIKWSCCEHHAPEDAGCWVPVVLLDVVIVRACLFKTIVHCHCLICFLLSKLGCAPGPRGKCHLQWLPLNACQPLH